MRMILEQVWRRTLWCSCIAEQAYPRLAQIMAAVESALHRNEKEDKKFLSQKIQPKTNEEKDDRIMGSLVI